jgi:thiol:disulfide interchange protein DsbC
MRHLFTTLALAACIALPAGVHADEGELRATLEKRLPGTRIGAISRLPFGDMYEVVVNGINIIYVDKSGDFAIQGNLIDLKTRQSITKKRSEELAFVDFGSIPLDKAIVKVKGDGSRKLVVFSDPDCPYCKQLEKELALLDNVTIYTMLYPLSELHPDARRKAELIWCSSDRARAWDNLMLFGREPESNGNKCDTPIDDIAQVATRLYINGTPGMVFENGRLVPGVLQATDIEDQLRMARKS